MSLGEGQRAWEFLETYRSPKARVAVELRAAKGPWAVSMEQLLIRLGRPP